MAYGGGRGQFVMHYDVCRKLWAMGSRWGSSYVDMSRSHDELVSRGQTTMHYAKGCGHARLMMNA